MDRDSFEREAEETLQNLRSALGGIIAGVPGGISNAADLQRRLRIDNKLSWKILKVVKSPTPLAAGVHVPGAPSMKAFLQAAEREGVATSLIESAAQTTREFEQVVARHAGDRSTFESMTCELAPNDDTERVDLIHRRASFRAARHIWGVSAKTRLVTRVVRPCEDSASFDIATMQGYLNIQSLRSGARVIISHSKIGFNDGRQCETNVEALDPEANTKHGIAIVPEFCSQPPPTIRTVQTDDGFIAGELCGNGLGNTAAVTCVVGSVVRNLHHRWHEPPHNESMQMYALIRVPCEVLILDTFVQEGFFAPGMPTAFAFAECGAQSDYPQIVEKRLCAPIRASVERIGRGPSAVHSPDVPQYTEMANYMFDRLKTSGHNYDLYRCRIEYPVMPSMAVVIFDLLPNPQE